VELRERRRSDALDRYWDASQQGRETPRPVEVDDVTAAVIRQLGTAEPALPLTDTQDRVRARVAARARAGNEPTVAMAAPTTPWAPAAPDRARAGPEPRSGRTVVHLATAALMLLTLGLAFVALGPGRANLEPGTAVPVAIEGPPAAVAGTTATTLVGVTVPAAYLPPEQVVGSGFAHVAVPPRRSSTWTTPALRIEYVLTGEFKVRSDGPSQVLRAGATRAEDIAAGSTIAMAPGDALLAPPGTTSDYANDDAQAAEMLSWVAGPNAQHQPPAPTAWTVSNYTEIEEIRLPTSALTVRFQRVELLPDASWTAPADTLHFIIPADREYTIARAGDGAWTNVGATASAIFVAEVNAAGTETLMP
jgi:hypothetical protein